MLSVLPLHPPREKRGSVRGRGEGTLDTLVTQRRIWEHWKEREFCRFLKVLPVSSKAEVGWTVSGACFMGSLLHHSTSGPFYQDHCSVAMIRKGKRQPRWAQIHKGVQSSCWSPVVVYPHKHTDKCSTCISPSSAVPHNLLLFIPDPHNFCFSKTSSYWLEVAPA